MNAQTWASIISDSVIAIAAGATAVFAFIGLRTWHKELTGKAKFELAKDVVRLALKINGDFAWVRNPFGWNWEWSSRKPESGDSDKNINIRNYLYARLERLKPLIEHYNQFMESCLGIEVLLKEKNFEPIATARDTYSTRLNDLAVDIREYFKELEDEEENRGIETDKYVLQNKQNYIKELKSTVYYAKEDEFSKSIEDATKALIKALKNYIS